MDQDLDLKDLRVPTFIPFDVDEAKKSKKATKRKRAAQPDSKPNKRKAKKVIDKVDGPLDDFIVADAKVEKPTQENEIWVGAAVRGDYGAYQIYYGEDDERNFNGIYKKENELQDVDYAYVLGTLKAIEALKSSATPFIVNTTCRDLPRAITGRGKNFHYTDLANQIRDAIKQNEQDIQVRHLSGRTSTVEHKIAMVLAKDVLDAHLKPAEEEVVEEKVVEKETIIEEKTIIEEPVKTVKEEVVTTEVVVSNDDDNKENLVSNLVVGAAEQTFDEITTTTTTTTVTTEVTLETKVDVLVTEKDGSEVMDLDQKSLQEPETPSTSWASRFGIRNLLDVLYAPFKTRKSS